jgi:cysteine protease ATG4
LKKKNYKKIEKNEKELKSRTESFFRFTYRKDFPSLSPYNITSDAGWGCMLRSAQMLMGNAMVRHYLGDGFYYLFIKRINYFKLIKPN